VARLIRSIIKNWSGIACFVILMKKSHERSQKPFIAAGGFLGLLCPMTYPAVFSPRKVNAKSGLIPEDDLPRMAKSQKMN
jgi:hypothetical protein